MERRPGTNTVAVTQSIEDFGTEIAGLWAALHKASTPQEKAGLFQLIMAKNAELTQAKRDLEKTWESNRQYMQGIRGWILRKIFRVKLITGPTKALLFDESWRMLERQNSPLH